MRDWIYGFFMAWGMFLAIPCPKKIWSETARRKMLACLPFVGIVVGAVWALCAWLAGYLPRALGAALGAAAPWLVTGFLHLDGFMDVCDGILSRRDLETRRRILKDSHCGAFAVICMVLLAMAQWSAFLSMENVPLLPLALIFSENSMSNLQTVSIIAAFPVGIIMLLIISSFFKDADAYLKEQANPPE